MPFFRCRFVAQNVLLRQVLLVALFMIRLVYISQLSFLLCSCSPILDVYTSDGLNFWVLVFGVGVTVSIDLGGWQLLWWRKVAIVFLFDSDSDVC